MRKVNPPHAKSLKAFWRQRATAACYDCSKERLALDSDTNASIKSRGDSPLFTRPRGMLLHGPSGTGKSLLARSLCKAANVAVEVLSHGVLLTLYVGDVEKRLAKTFSRREDDHHALCLSKTRHFMSIALTRQQH